MRTSENRKGSRERLLRVAGAAALVATTLVACGGGGGSGGGGGFPIAPIGAAPASTPAPAPSEPPPAAPPPPANSNSSAPCLNEADYHAGTVLETESELTSPGGAPTVSNSKITIGERESFAGANPVSFTTPDIINGSVTTTSKGYKDLVGGNSVAYGSITATATPEGTVTNTTVFEPPVSFPADMQPGQMASQSYVQKNTSASTIDGGSAANANYDMTTELTYHGRETLQTPLGTFNVCKFSSKMTMKKPDTETTVVLSDNWLAADGPYRGQSLKQHFDATAAAPELTIVVTKMNYMPK